MLYTNKEKFDSLLYELDKEWLKLAPVMMFYEDSALDTNKVSMDIRNFYFKDKSIDRSMAPQFVKVSTDM